jgi:hypothetical protein
MVTVKVVYVPAEPAVERDEALQIAARWVEHESAGRHGKVLVVVPVRNSIDHSDVLARILARYRDWETTQTVGHNVGRADVVLAVWASADMLEKISARRPRAICVVQWREEESNDWLSAHAGEDLSSRAPGLEPPTIADPIVRVAIQGMTQSVNLNNRLYQVEDRDAAILTLRLLHKRDHALHPDEIYRWALAHGWPDEGARNLREIAQELLAGRKHRTTRPDYGDDVYGYWKKEATEVRGDN